MPTLRYEDVPADLAQQYISWKSVRDDYTNHAEKSEEYFNNDVEGTKTLYTKEQINKIGGLSNIPVSVNYLYPVTSQKLAIIVRSKPSHKVIASDTKGVQWAQIIDKMKHQVMYNSKGTEQIKQFAKKFLVIGQAGLFIDESTMYKPGAFNTTLRFIHPKRYIIDPNCIDETNDDAEGCFIEGKITISKAKQLYGDILAAINEAQAINPDGTVNPDYVPMGWEAFTSSISTLPANPAPLPVGKVQSIDVVEYYEPYITTAFRVKDATSGDIITIFEENSVDPKTDPLFAGEFIDKEHGVFVKKTLILGNKVVSIEIKPIRSLPLKVGYFEWSGSPYKSYGMIHFAQGMQEAYDKVIQLLLVNGILTNNAGWTAPKNSIAPEDQKKWQEQGNDPTVIKEFTPQVIEGQVFKPERDKVQQLSNFYPMFLSMMKDGIEYSSGINAIVRGDAKEAGVDVFASLQQFQNSANERIVMALSSINRIMEGVGSVIIDHLLEELKPNSNRTFFDENGDFNEVTVSKEMVEQIKTVRWNILSVPAEAMPTQRMAFGTELLKIAQTTPDPSERSLFVNEAIKLSDMHSARGLVEKLDVVKNLQSNIQGMQEQLKRAQEIMKQMENKALNSDYRARLADMILQAAIKLAKVEGRIDNEMKKKLHEYEVLKEEGETKESA